MTIYLQILMQSTIRIRFETTKTTLTSNAQEHPIWVTIDFWLVCEISGSILVL